MIFEEENNKRSLFHERNIETRNEHTHKPSNFFPFYFWFTAVFPGMASQSQKNKETDIVSTRQCREENPTTTPSSSSSSTSPSS
jgi:hypothetical protein